MIIAVRGALRLLGKSEKIVENRKNNDNNKTARRVYTYRREIFTVEYA